MATGGVRTEKEKYLIEFLTYLFSQFLLSRAQMPSIGTAQKEKTDFELVLCKFVISTKFVGPCMYLLHRDLVTPKTIFINFNHDDISYGQNSDRSIDLECFR